MSRSPRPWVHGAATSSPQSPGLCPEAGCARELPAAGWAGHGAGTAQPSAQKASHSELQNFRDGIRGPPPPNTHTQAARPRGCGPRECDAGSLPLRAWQAGSALGATLPPPAPPGTPPGSLASPGCVGAAPCFHRSSSGSSLRLLTCLLALRPGCGQDPEGRQAGLGPRAPLQPQQPFAAALTAVAPAPHTHTSRCLRGARRPSAETWTF